MPVNVAVMHSEMLTVAANYEDQLHGNFGPPSLPILPHTALPHFIRAFKKSNVYSVLLLGVNNNMFVIILGHYCLSARFVMSTSARKESLPCPHMPQKAPA